VRAKKSNFFFFSREICKDEVPPWAKHERGVGAIECVKKRGYIPKEREIEGKGEEPNDRGRRSVGIVNG